MDFPQTWIPFVKIGFLLIFLYSIYSGYRNGFALKILDLLTTVVSVVLAWVLSGVLNEHIMIVPNKAMVGITMIDDMLYALANKLFLFLVLFILLRIVTRILKPLLKVIDCIPFISMANHLAGAFVGILQGTFLVGVLLFLLSTPLFRNGETVIRESGLYEGKALIQSIFEDTFTQMQSMQKLSADELMQDEDYQNIINWMNKQGFSARDQAEIITILKERYA